MRCSQYLTCKIMLSSSILQNVKVCLSKHYFIAEFAIHHLRQAKISKIFPANLLGMCLNIKSFRGIKITIKTFLRRSLSKKPSPILELKAPIDFRNLKPDFKFFGVTNVVIVVFRIFAHFFTNQQVYEMFPSIFLVKFHIIHPYFNATTWNYLPTHSFIFCFVADFLSPTNLANSYISKMLMT